VVVNPELATYAATRSGNLGNLIRVTIE